MPLLSIIGCELFKNEIAQVLINDGAIDSLVIVNGNNPDFEKELEGTNARVESVSADSIPPSLKRSNGFNVIIALQSASLNSDSCKLNKEIYEKIRFYGKISDGILLLYGQEDDELENLMSAFRRAGFSLKSVGNCADISPGMNGPLSDNGSPAGRDDDKETLRIYQKVYADMRAELGLADQLA
ncbi:hypothetical protein [Methanolobus chelungpuianus]|uniref:DUF1638 domain-containing protein n=1 Tax=Methanolobus chelungpuianus TaxID=502115 RepID=A0AAE3KXH3_9EURY|nr:hypothetical protein [Methanolobus chelungpuianus]MCQ6962812.1 hypothetical protein [Methanolobus chelungpuianus]